MRTDTNRNNKALYNTVDSYEYKNGVFAGGLVEKSTHKANTVYLQIKGCVFDLREDEANAIISVLSQSLWSDYHLTKTAKKKLKWVPIEKILK